MSQTLVVIMNPQRLKFIQPIVGEERALLARPLEALPCLTSTKQ